MILIEHHSTIPIYEQIKLQFKSLIASKKLLPHSMLPSVRVLAKTLQVGIITVKHAYDDLVIEEFLYVVKAKGYYVSDIQHVQVKQNYFKQIQTLIKQINNLKEAGQIKDEELIEFFKKSIGETK